MEVIVGFTVIAVCFRSPYAGLSFKGSTSPSNVSVVEYTAEDSVVHMSVFNALYFLAIALAMAGWVWLILIGVGCAIGG